MNSNNPVAVITGSAGGLGAEYAKQLAAKGYDLILIDKALDKLKDRAAEIRAQYSVNITVWDTDLADSSEIAKRTAELANLPQVAFFVHAAGFTTVSREFHESELQKEIDMIMVHDVTAVSFIRAILPAMIKAKKGHIVAVSSITSFIPSSAASCTYTASKLFLNGMIDTLRYHTKGSGVKLQCLCPGFIWGTNFFVSTEYTASGANRNIGSLPNFLRMTPEQIVRTSLLKLEKGPVFVIPGLIYRIVRNVGTNRVMLYLWHKFSGFAT